MNSLRIPSTSILIVLVSLGAFVFAPIVPIIIPCTKGGDGTIGHRFVGFQSASYAWFGVGISTAPGADCYLP